MVSREKESKTNWNAYTQRSSWATNISATTGSMVAVPDSSIITSKILRRFPGSWQNYKANSPPAQVHSLAMGSSEPPFTDLPKDRDLFPHVQNDGMRLNPQEVPVHIAQEEFANFLGTAISTEEEGSAHLLSMLKCRHRPV